MRRVTEDWHGPERPPLVMRAGDRVTVGEASDDWPAYRWCTAPDGRQGWVPGDVLEVEGGEGRALLPYSTVELTVQRGDEVEPIEFMADWWWCRDRDGAEGWLPERVLGDETGSA